MEHGSFRDPARNGTHACRAILCRKTTISKIGRYYQILSVFCFIDKKKCGHGNNFSLLASKILKSFSVITLIPILFYLIVFSLFRHSFQVLARRVVLSGKKMMRGLFGFPVFFFFFPHSVNVYVGGS